MLKAVHVGMYKWAGKSVLKKSWEHVLNQALEAFEALSIVLGAQRDIKCPEGRSDGKQADIAMSKQRCPQ